MAHKLDVKQRRELRKSCSSYDIARYEVSAKAIAASDNLALSYGKRSDRWKKSRFGIEAQDLIDSLETLAEAADNSELNSAFLDF